MKSILKRAVSGAVSTAVAVGSLTIATDLSSVGLLAANAGRTSVSLVYDDNGQKTETFEYDLDYYLDDTYSCTYNPKLAHMLVTLAAGAYDKECTKLNFDTLGFTFEEGGQFGYGEETTDADNIGYSIGTKTTKDGTDECLIVIRGTAGDFGKTHEWWSDFNVGFDSIGDDGGYHEGFKTAADEILSHVPQCTRYIVTGHSRGAAVGNIIAQQLTEYNCNKNYARVYDYNFAVPDVGYFSGGDFGEYDNIYNISNALDPVSLVPGNIKYATAAGLGELLKRLTNQAVTKYWGKYGNSFWFSEDWSDFYDNEETNISNFMERAATYHPPGKYVEYLKNEPDLLQFRNKECLYWQDTEQTVLDHLTYTIDGTVTITGCDNMLRDIEIPKKIEGKRVTAIGSQAFMNCHGLKSVTLPDSIISIGSGAFEDCERLDKVNIPDSVTEIKSNTFKNCSSLASIEIPDSVSSIGNNAFSYCTSLESIEIPDSVSSIEIDAFWDCSALENVTIPDSVTTILDGAFRDCVSLESIELPDSISSLGSGRHNPYGVFNGCTSLKSVKLPSYLDYINPNLFANCKSLNNVVIPSTVKEIGYGAFEGCSSLTGIELPDGLEEIGYSAFQGCSGKFKSITVPLSVTSIGSQALGYSESSKFGDFVINGFTNTEAERYANDNKIRFNSIGVYTDPTTTSDVTTEPIITIPTTSLTAQQTAGTSTQYTIETVIKTTETETKPPVTIETTTTTKATSESTTTTKEATTTTRATSESTTTSEVTTAPAENTTKQGDVNNDGTINLKDVVMLRRYIAGGWGVKLDEGIADVNGDGTVNLKDVVLLRRYIAGGWKVELKSAK